MTMYALACILALSQQVASESIQTTCGQIRNWYTGADTPCCERLGGTPSDMLSIDLPPRERATLHLQGKTRPLPFASITIPHAVAWDHTNTTAVVTIPSIAYLSAFIGRMESIDPYLFYPQIPTLTLYHDPSLDITGLVPNWMPYTAFNP